LSLSVLNNNYAASSARANLYQGTAAVASWLSSLAGAQMNASTPAPSTSNPASPTGLSSYGPTPYSQFRSQVSAATTPQSQDIGSGQTESQGASDYQQAVAAYGDN